MTTTTEPIHQLRRAKSLTEQAVEAIRARIVSGHFELGAPLSENALASELGVSKTPIREALLQLKSEGLVSVQPQRGTFVFDMSAAEIEELGELRETLETTALKLAAARAVDALACDLSKIVDNMQGVLDLNDVLAYRMLDADFHRAFFEHCGNRYLLASYLGIAFRIQALRTRLSANPVLNQSSFNDHAELARLLADKQVSRAGHVLAGHVRRTISDFVATIDRRDQGAEGAVT